MPRTTTTLIGSLFAALSCSIGFAQTPNEAHTHRFSADVDAFHSVLAPLWHAPAGKERAQNTCAQTSRLDQLARDIRSADAKPLVASIGNLQTQCQTHPSDIDAALKQVHQAFHQLIEQPPR